MLRHPYLQEMITYLRSPDGFATKRKSLVTTGFLVCWLLVVIVVSMHHEVWRDEVRALSVAVEADSVWQLPSLLRYEGHPILWYLVLRWGFWVFQSPLILKIAAVSVALAGVCLFIARAPFPMGQKLLFLWGILPLYQYSVMARNYGISMVLFFAFAALYPVRKQRPFLLAVILALLANTNVHSCMFAALLTVFWIWEDVVLVFRSLSRRQLIILGCVFAVVAAGGIGALLSTLPGENSIVAKPGSLDLKHIADAIWESVKKPGAAFENLFYFGDDSSRPRLFVRDYILPWTLVAGLLICPHAAALLFASMVMLGTFFITVYTGMLRHQGIFFLFLLTLYWIVYQRQTSYRNAKLRPRLNLLHKGVVYTALTAIFLLHILRSVSPVYEDFSQAYSSSKALGAFLNAHEEYRNAIILGEADYLLEALPYYCDHRIYIPREERFGTHVKFTSENKQELSLGELLDSAQNVRQDTGQPVLIAFGHYKLVERAVFEKRFSYQKKFTWSPEELAEFHEYTEKIAEFKSAMTDFSENYEIYRLH